MEGRRKRKKKKERREVGREGEKEGRKNFPPPNLKKGLFPMKWW